MDDATDDEFDATIARINELSHEGAHTGKWDLDGLVEAHVALGLEEGPVREWVEAVAAHARSLDSSPEGADRLAELWRRAVASHEDPSTRFYLLQDDTQDSLLREGRLARRRLKMSARRTAQAFGVEGVLSEAEVVASTSALAHATDVVVRLMAAVSNRAGVDEEDRLELELRRALPALPEAFRGVFREELDRIVEIRVLRAQLEG